MDDRLDTVRGFRDAVCVRKSRASRVEDPKEGRKEDGSRQWLVMQNQSCSVCVQFWVGQAARVEGLEWKAASSNLDCVLHFFFSCDFF